MADMSSFHDDVAREALHDWLDEREPETSDERDARMERIDDEARDGERFGFGVCVRGNCVEPCGDFGGCKR